LTELGLRDLGDADLDRIVAAALTDPSAGGNPRALTAENTRALLESCLSSG
jgi:alcohol dehydrogenase class IV